MQFLLPQKRNYCFGGMDLDNTKRPNGHGPTPLPGLFGGLRYFIGYTGYKVMFRGQKESAGRHRNTL